MFRKTMLLLIAGLQISTARAQQTGALDSIPDYDALFSELESFLDSILAPHSFTTINIGVSNAAFQYQTGRNMEEQKRLLITPSAGYFHKSGFGLSGSASLVAAHPALFYQTDVTASYDYLKNRAFLTGISFTHVFTRDSLDFYTSPLSNDVFAYFSYRKWWLKPTLAAGYGWGSLTSVTERKEKIKLLKGKPLTSTTITETTENIADISVTASVKHDFYWLNVLSKKDYFRVTPQVVLSGGTQKYGISQSNNSYASEKHSDASVLYKSENQFLSSRSQFQLLSLSGRLRTEFSKGIYFVQPQLLFNYYFPEKESPVFTSFVINAGILF